MDVESRNLKRMKITSYILDDEAPARERMEYLINSFFGREVKIIGKSSSPETALKEIPKLKPYIAFLDVEMPGMSGLELAGQLKAKGFKGKIVFVTAFDHYSVKALRANAFDYLVKPVDVDELKQCLNRFNGTIEKKFDESVIKNFELSKREMEIISHLAQGLSSEEVAAEMFLSRHTVDTHRRNIHAKTDTRNTIELLSLLHI